MNSLQSVSYTHLDVYKRQAQRTPLARFIDLSALWSLSLMIWFYVLLARLRQLYPALLLACACAAATLGLWALLRRALISRRRAALPEDLVRQLCAHVALMPPDAARDAVATWLRFSGTYPKCTRAGDALEAASHDGELITIAPVSYTHLDVYKRQSTSWS